MKLTIPEIKSVSTYTLQPNEIAKPMDLVLVHGPMRQLLKSLQGDRVLARVVDQMLPFEHQSAGTTDISTAIHQTTKDSFPLRVFALPRNPLSAGLANAVCDGSCASDA